MISLCSTTQLFLGKIIVCVTFLMLVPRTTGEWEEGTFLFSVAICFSHRRFR